MSHIRWKLGLLRAHDLALKCSCVLVLLNEGLARGVVNVDSLAGILNTHSLSREHDEQSSLRIRDRVVLLPLHHLL